MSPPARASGLHDLLRRSNPRISMSDSLDLNVSPASPETPKRRVARTKKRPHSRRPALPDWAPWAVLGGLIVVGAVGSRVVQAAVASSEAPKASDAANTGATAAPPAAS